MERLFDGELAVERQLLRHVANVGTRDQGLSEQICMSYKGQFEHILFSKQIIGETVFQDIKFWVIGITVRNQTNGIGKMIIDYVTYSSYEPSSSFNKLPYLMFS